MKKSRISCTIAVLACLTSAHANAQISTRPPSISDSVQSIKVSSDNRVTFSIYAPKAAEVTVSGDFRMGAPPANLAKNDDGVWSFTSDPLPPDSYTYNFNVDGVSVLDTKSLTFRENPNALFNFFDMPGSETDFMALKNVPHGRVESVLYHSSSLNTERRIHVYLPPGFEKMKGPLPVLYLLHGGGDNDISWTSAGKVNLILDNLYAEGKLKNMIVVMPSGHTTTGRPFAAMGVGLDLDPFLKDFFNDIMPLVEKTYPISTKREDTAICGFSMGGVQTLNVALWHPEKFAYVYPMGTGYFPDGLKELEEKDSAILTNISQHPFKQLIFGLGKDDRVLGTNNLATRTLFDKFNIKYQFLEFPGGHSFVFTRRFFVTVFPQMFR